MMKSLVPIFAAALLLGSADGPATGPAFAADAGTVVISGAKICRDEPANPWCQGKPAPVSRQLSIAVPNQTSEQLQALSRDAPWMRGDVPWCEAFPGSAHCANQLVARR